MIATIIDSLAIIVGSIAGFLVKGKINEKVNITIMNGLALCVICMGISGALKGSNTLLMIISVAIGGLIGELLDLESKIENLGLTIEKKLNKGGKNISIAQGFVTATLLFCVGAMGIVGSLESGLHNNNSILFAKSVLDGVASVIFSSSLGIGVMLSSISVLVYQGVITLGAGFLSSILSEGVIANMSAVGSLLIIGLGLNVLGVTKIRISNLLPAMLVAIILTFFM